MASFQRVPYTEMFVHDLQSHDFRVAVSGVIVDREEGSFVLDDGTGSVLILAQDQGARVQGQVVRVLGTVSPTASGVMVIADLVQDWSSVDAGILKKVKERVLHRRS